MMSKSVEEMTDEEVADFLSAAKSRATGEASADQRAGGAPFEYSLLSLLCSLAGVFASAQLLLAERSLLSHPGDEIDCDINPLVGCSSFLTSSWNTAIGDVPNALWGLMFFSGVAGLALALLSGAKLGRWLWRALAVAMVGAAAYLVWFWHVSFFVKHSLCPYCMLTWGATIPLIVHTWIRCAQAGHIPCPQALRGLLVRGRWPIVAAAFLAVCVLGVVTLADRLSIVL